ncbi:hypothetical protein P154DRAFT_521442 [Amniculicola lignicola CBS 123094]|uniref:Uncharacterized protein n=1 Tax=Amniculicola lignicola CBS 123094 TaxID=1392246 RepID=A0A6A5WJB8_9PLEO|nr:hypothetical protein P154DRAFT_521442 [Amniculicola lignicola CBS 123094]
MYIPCTNLLIFPQPLTCTVAARTTTRPAVPPSGITAPRLPHFHRPGPPPSAQRHRPRKPTEIEASTAPPSSLSPPNKHCSTSSRNPVKEHSRRQHVAKPTLETYAKKCNIRPGKSIRIWGKTPTAMSPIGIRKRGLRGFIGREIRKRAGAKRCGTLHPRCCQDCDGQGELGEADKVTSFVENLFREDGQRWKGMMESKLDCCVQVCKR